MVQSQAIWQKTKSGGKTGFDKLWGWADKLGAPVNRLSNRLGSEAFWPTTLDKECDKAARILRSFCKDGFYQEEEPTTADGPKQKQRVLKKVPAEVIRNAKGLAIFTTMRTGLWVSGAGGSGILVGRQSDGSWSPPSGIMLHTAGLGFLVGVDIYDCVLVLNSQQAVDAFSKVRCTLGGEVSAVAGPVGIGGVLESEVHKRQAPIFTYLKSRGFYAGVQIDGTIVIERTDENERFYGERIGVADILAGKAKNPPFEIMRLMETIRAAQGDTDINQSLLTDEPPPSDFQVNSQEGETTKFGIPDEEDPDPFGVLALEKQGLLIREAGTNKRPTSEQFEFKPSPTSPIYTTFRRSMDRSSIDSRTISRRSSWRTSTMSTLVDRGSQTVDMATQTDFEPPAAQVHPPALPPRHEQSTSPKMAEIPEHRSTDDEKEGQELKQENQPEVTEEIAENMKKEEVKDEAPKEQVTEKKDEQDKKSEIIDQVTDEAHDSSNRESKKFDKVDSEDEADDVDDADDADDADDDEVAIVQEVHQAAAPQVITRARLVTVAKPIPPKLPPRNPYRTRLTVNSELANDGSAVMRDQGAGPSPMTATAPRSPSTPSLHHDHSSASSKDSISSAEGIEGFSEKIEPKIDVAVDGEKDSKLEIQPAPDSPVKQLPGSFQ